MIRVGVPDVRAIRKELGLTQEEFAETYGFKLGALRNWEQGRRRPDRSARLLLAIIEQQPEVMKAAIQQLEKA